MSVLDQIKAKKYTNSVAPIIQTNKKQALRANIAEDFNTVGDFSGTNCTLGADTAKFMIGTASVKATMSGAVTANVDKTISIDMANTDYISLWYYISAGDFLDRVYLYITKTPWSKTFQYTHTKHKIGWNHLRIHKNQFTNTGEETWGTMTNLRVAIKTIAAGEVSLGLLAFESISKPCVIFTFDDNYDNLYTNIYPMFMSRGIKGCLGIISSVMDTANHLTTAQLKDFYDAGFDICNHTDQTEYIDTLTLKGQYNAINNCNLYFKENGLVNDGNRFLVFPNSRRTDIDIMLEGMGLWGARGVAAEVQSIPVDNYYALNGVSPANFAAAQPYVDKVILNGCTAIFYYHGVDAAAATEIALTVDYCITNNVSIKTLSEWYREVNNMF